jgi:hypothetical protein
MTSRLVNNDKLWFDMTIAVKRDIDTTRFFNERQVRKWLSELRPKGIVYIPVSSRVYRHVDQCTKAEIQTYVGKQLAHMKKQYFNTLKPLKDVLEDVTLKEKIGELNLW